MNFFERQKIIHIYSENCSFINMNANLKGPLAAADAEDSADSQFYFFVQLIESSQTKQTV